MHGSPDERLRIFVPRREEGLNRSLQVRHAAEDTSADRLAVQVSEPALDQVQPTGTRGDEVKHKAWVPLEPVPHLLMVVSSVVIHDEMEVDITRELLVQLA